MTWRDTECLGWRAQACKLFKGLNIVPSLRAAEGVGQCLLAHVLTQGLGTS